MTFSNTTQLFTIPQTSFLPYFIIQFWEGILNPTRHLAVSFSLTNLLAPWESHFLPID